MEEKLSQKSEPTKAEPAKTSHADKKVIIIVIAAVLLLAAFGAGWFVWGKTHIQLTTPGTTQNNESSKSAENALADCTYDDPNICQFLEAWKSVNNVTVAAILTSTSGATTTSISEMQDNDKSHIITYGESGEEIANWITIGTTLYAKDYADNVWWKQEMDAETKELAEAQNAVSPYEEDDTTTFIKIGSEACGLLTCFKYQVIDSTTTDSMHYIYFDTKDYLQRKDRVEAKDGSVTESTYQYGTANITEPSPTKDASPDQNILIAPGSPLYEEATQRATDEIIRRFLEKLNSGQNP